MSKILKHTVKASLLLVLSISANSANAYIDERSAQPVKANLVEPTLKVSPPEAPLQISSFNSVSIQQPQDTAAFQPAPAPMPVSHGKMAQKHNITQGQMPLADALISLYFPVVNEAVELNSPPLVLARSVNVEQGATRSQSVESIERQLGLQISLEGNTVNVVQKGSSLAATAAPAQSSYKSEVSLGAVEEVVVVETYKTPVKETTWSLRGGEMLSDELQAYALSNGIKLIWDAQVDYKIAIPFSMTRGAPLENIQAVLSLYEKSTMPLQHVWYDKQNLILIKDSPVY